MQTDKLEREVKKKRANCEKSVFQFSQQFIYWHYRTSELHTAVHKDYNTKIWYFCLQD